MKSELEVEIERIYSNHRELARIVSEIGSGASDEADHMALSQAVAEIAEFRGSNFYTMRGCDESPAECIQRIVAKYVRKEAAYNVGGAGMSRVISDEQFKALREYIGNDAVTDRINSKELLAALDSLPVLPPAASVEGGECVSFQKWAYKESYDLTPHPQFPGRYEDDYTDAALAGWQAAQACTTLYHAVNQMMAPLGADGEITARDSRVTAVMDALHAIDGGSYEEPKEYIDAARYQYLRNRDLDTMRGGVFAGMVPANIVLNGEDLDREVDLARRIVQQNGEVK